MAAGLGTITTVGHITPTAAMVLASVNEQPFAGVVFTLPRPVYFI